MEKGIKMEYFLIDNGSLRPGSIIQMRQVAHELSVLTGHQIRPFGLMHSHKVDPKALEDEPANSMQKFLTSDERQKVEEIRALPFFLGPSMAITDWLPVHLKQWEDENPECRKFRILNPLWKEGDNRVAQSMADLCREKIKSVHFKKPFVAMVDHGTPLLEVNEVREEVGRTMERILDGEIGGFSTCSMERRPGSEYDFNNPLLSDLLSDWFDQGISEVVVSQFFLLPGRHAGPDGDLAQICQPFIDKGMRLYRTDQLGQHPLILEILSDAIREDQKSSC